MNTRRRLGVSPGPVALNGPVTVNDFTCGRPVESYVPALLRRNGRRRFVFSAIFLMNVAVTSRGPAFTGTRTRNRASVASDFSLMVPV